MKCGGEQGSVNNCNSKNNEPTDLGLLQSKIKWRKALK